MTTPAMENMHERSSVHVYIMHACIRDLAKTMVQLDA